MKDAFLVWDARSILFLVSERRTQLLSGGIAALGTAAYAMPLVGPSYLLLLLAAGGCLLLASKYRFFVAGLVFGLVLAVLTLKISPTITIAIFSAMSVTLLGSPILGVAILWMQTSVVATMQEFVANGLFHLHMEAAGPALVAIVLLWLSQRRRVLSAITAALFAVVLVRVAIQWASTPAIPMALGALPACCLAGWLGWTRKSAEGIRGSTPFLILVLAGIFSWLNGPPRTFDEIALVLPNAPSAFEASYFANYADALRFAGLDVKVADQLTEIKPNSLVLLPWLTQPLINDASKVDQFRRLSRERRWTILAAGEHTNLGGVADQVKAFSGRALFRHDLTVPTNNSDNSGPLRATDLRGWRHDAILNRGSSVQISSPADRVLLAGDGWWAEPDIGEWLWVGDYLWELRDRGGRLAVAAAVDVDGARWIVVGDNTPFINSQIYADPRPLLRFVELASLWPVLVWDLLLVAIGGILCLSMVNFRWNVEVPYAATCLVVCVALVQTYLVSLRSQKWEDLYIGESGHDIRNFNTTLAEHPMLWKRSRVLRSKYSVSGPLPLPSGRSTIFMLVEGSAEIGGAKFSGCRRLGALADSAGPYLMDAQVCRVEGATARVLLGNRDHAAAVEIQQSGAVAIVILDSAFLSQRAPPENAKWLLAQLPQ